MTERYPPINSRCPHILHGADYNPDQWPEEVWTEDMRLMKLAHCNAMSICIFAWARLEPEEGRFEFGWLDRMMDLLAENGGYAVMGTPSAARPAWLSAGYPEVLRVRPDRGRNLHGERNNYCFTSPIYREKVTIINARLAERYRDHPALLVWHVGNEIQGECHCDLCRAAFRDWLQRKYGTLQALNHAWWTAFWSHTYTDWSQLEPPARIGEFSIPALDLDWKRFVTDQTLDFFKVEIAPLKEFTPDVPVTTNFIGINKDVNYWKFAPHVDVVSWDVYPDWHRKKPEWREAVNVSFGHDLNRSLKGGQPFMLMENTPSTCAWWTVLTPKRPGMNLLSSIQAIAHGSDAVQYFQFRRSRGGCEKVHTGIVDHCGHENTRVFREVAKTGEALERLDPVIGATVQPDVAIIFDWENMWCIAGTQGPWRKEPRQDYTPTCTSHYSAFWRRGIPIDIIDMMQDISKYKLVVAPMLYMVRPGVAEAIEAFVKAGGSFVATYWTGNVDENDLCFLGGFPGPLRKVLGVWAEEIIGLMEGEHNHVAPNADHPLGLEGEYEARDMCEIIHAESAEVLATFRDDFYAGSPALTVNRFGKGRAYYIASRNDARFLGDFCDALAAELCLLRALDADLPEGVTAQLRTDGEKRFVFLMNFNAAPATVDLGGCTFTDLLTKEQAAARVCLDAYGVMVLVE